MTSFRILSLPKPAQGQLFLHAMPGRRESWPDFMHMAQAAALTRIVCLTPRAEIAALSPEYLQAIEENRLPCSLQEIAMADYGVSADAHEFARQVHELARALTQGESALLHCAGGNGRTGTVAACVLKALGLPTQEAMAWVSQAGSNPESALQSGWVDAF